VTPKPRSTSPLITIMKMFFCALVILSVARAARRDLWIQGSTGATLPTRGYIPATTFSVGQPDLNCPSTYVANLGTTPYLCIATEVLTPLTAAGITFPSTFPSLSPWQLQQAASAAQTAAATGQLFAAAGMSLFYPVPAIQTAICGSTQTGNGGTGAYCEGGAMNATLFAQLPAAAQTNVSQNFATSLCTFLKPILSAGASCASAACANTTWNSCDGDNNTQGYGTYAAAGINAIAGAAKLSCAFGAGGFGTGTFYTCEQLLPSSKFGTYVVPPTAAPASGNSSNTTLAPGSPASTIELGVLAAASVLVAALTL